VGISLKPVHRRKWFHHRLLWHEGSRHRSASSGLDTGRTTEPGLRRPAASVLLPLLWVALTLCGADATRGTPAATALDVPVLVTQIPAVVRGTVMDRTAAHPTALPGDRGRIILLSPSGTQRLLTEGFHSAADPSVSFDAKRFVFAGKRTANDLWNVYEYSLEDGQVRQVTRDMGNCRQPGYQSNLFTVDSPEPWF